MYRGHAFASMAKDLGGSDYRVCKHSSLRGSSRPSRAARDLDGRMPPFPCCFDESYKIGIEGDACNPSESLGHQLKGVA